MDPIKVTTKAHIANERKYAIANIRCEWQVKNYKTKFKLIDLF